jgi:hypothetical protein
LGAAPLPNPSPKGEGLKKKGYEMLKKHYNRKGLGVSPLERGAERSDGGVCKIGNTPPPDGVGVLLSRGDKRECENVNFYYNRKGLGGFFCISDGSGSPQRSED